MMMMMMAMMAMMAMSFLFLLLMLSSSEDPFCCLFKIASIYLSIVFCLQQNDCKEGKRIQTVSFVVHSFLECLE